MNKKTKKVQPKKITKQHTPLSYTEGYWEENSLWNINIVARANALIYKKIDKWAKKYAKSSSWLGKWYCQIQINRLKNKLQCYKNKP